MKVARSMIALVLFGVVSTLPAAEPANWLQWRGPTRDGFVTGTAWPNALKGDSLKPIWRVEKLGPSYSGPIVAADRVFTTETVGEKEEVVRAYRRSDGQLIWSTKWLGAMKVPFFARSNGDWIRSTPAYDGERLYVAGMRDVLVCLDGATGNEVWRIDFPQQLKTSLPDFGFVCSPLIDGDFVYVQAGGGFVKIDKKTGKVIWRTLVDGGGMFGSAFSSPYISTVVDQRQILVQTRTKLTGVDIETGNALWEQPIQAMRGMNILTPIVFNGGVFTSAYGGKSLFIDLNKGSNSITPSTKWTHRSEAYMSTPVVIDGYAYMHLRNQRIMCIDLRTGKEMWTTSRSYGKYWSMVAQGDRILALDERGILYLIKANPKQLEVIDERKVSEEETWAHLAVCGDELYIRDLKGLTAWRWK